MKTSHLLAIILPLTILPTLLACIVFARFKFRSSRRSRSLPVDPGYESRMNRFNQSQAEKEGETDGQQEHWFGGSWGVTPLAGVGPNGTRTYLGGLFGLDGAQPAGWSSTGDVESPSAATYPASPRESHFSRASRASRRSALTYRGTDDEEGQEAVDEFGMESRAEGKRSESRASSSVGLMMREREPEMKAVDEMDSERERILRGVA